MLCIGGAIVLWSHSRIMDHAMPALDCGLWTVEDCGPTPLYEDLPISSATAVERSEGLRTPREHFI